MRLVLIDVERPNRATTDANGNAEHSSYAERRDTLREAGPAVVGTDVLECDRLIEQEGIDARSVTELFLRGLEDAARFLGVSKRHLIRLADLAKVKTISLGRRRLLPDSEIQRLATGGC